MVYQQNSIFDGGGLWDPRGWVSQERASGGKGKLRAMNYESGQAALSPRETEPITPTSLPYQQGSWTPFTETELKSVAGALPRGKGAAQDTCTWIQLCDHLGFHPSILGAFNPEEKGHVNRLLREHLILYVPSATEVVFWQTARSMQIPLRAESLRDTPEAVVQSEPSLVAAYRDQARTGAVDVVKSARHRAGGKTGRAYSVEAGRFYSRNRDLKGGRGRSKVDGSRERTIAWGDGNKCNVFVGDVLDQAGLDTPVSRNGHYATAGNIFARYSTQQGDASRSRHLFQEVSRAELLPGDIFIRNGGRGADMSHTEVITSVRDSVSFFALGAHYEGGYERHYFTDEAAYDAEIGRLAQKDPGQGTASDYDLSERHRVQYIDPTDVHFLRHRDL